VEQQAVRVVVALTMVEQAEVLLMVKATQVAQVTVVLALALVAEVEEQVLQDRLVILQVAQHLAVLAV